MYEYFTSYVKFRGFKSRSFIISQGTRQWGVTSPLIFLCFINDFLNILCNSGYGLRISGITVTCRIVADDMVLVSLTKRGLQELLKICYVYSKLWCYLYMYNALKWAVIVFNETASSYLRPRRQWTLGTKEVLEKSSYLHLGVECNKHMKTFGVVKEAASKVRRTFFAILNSGICERDLHPFTLRKIYQTVVMPRASSSLWLRILAWSRRVLEATSGTFP